MMWKTLILFAVVSVVLSGKINDKRHADYAFQIKHDYDYHKHHEKLEHHEVETKEQLEEDKKEEPVEEVQDEPEQSDENDSSNAESEEPENDDEKESRGYEFSFKVIDPHTHDKKGQHETKYDGEIKGVYWLLQPDGYKRTVDYKVDKHHGFQAKVDYSKLDEHNEHEGDSKAKSEIYVKTYHGSEKHIPVREEQEEEIEEDKQEESAEHIPIYVI